MLSDVKTEDQRRARELRAQGWSVKEIERELGVSRSSVSAWVRAVELTPDQRARLIARSRLGPIVAGPKKAAAAREIRRGYQNEGRRLARERGVPYAGGCMLYWAEGTKGRNSARVTNSDPEVLVFFANFLRAEFAVQDTAMTFRCNLFADHAAHVYEIEDFWLTQLGLPRSCLRKSMVNRYSKHSQKKRQNKLPYGTGEVTVNSTQIVQTIYGSIQEYGGFERAEWLD
jgi:transcriptional regulator with XRE-family HTH domain